MELADTLAGEVYVFGDDVASVGCAAVHESGDDRGSNSHVRIEHGVAFVGHGEDETLDQFDGELTRVYRLFGVVVLDVWKLPYVAWVLALWIAGQLADVWPLEVALTGILRRNADRVEVPGIVVALRPPVDRFVPTGKTSCTVQAVPKVPDDSVAELESEGAEYWIENRIERNNFPMFDLVSNLPTERPLRMEHTDALAYYALLRRKIVVQGNLRLVVLAEIVRR